MRALLLLLVFFFLNFTPDERPPNQVNQNPYSDNLLGEVETLFVPADNRGRFMVKPKGNSQPMQFCNLIPGQTYRIFAVKGENCEPKVSFEGGSEEQVLQFVAEEECQEFTYYGGMCQEATYVSIGCQTCEKDNTFLEDFALSVSPGADQYLVEDVFIGGNCFDVTGVTGIGPTQGRGQFFGGTFGLEEGVILSTGNINNATGPNNSGSAGNNMGGGGGDPDLAVYAGSHPTFDTEGIEFDFTPTINTMDFLFVFASEEYCEWVGSQFNDIFGFFISGPGISGPFSNGGINIGVVPGGATPITINTVNQTQNTSYFIPNSGGCGGSVNPGFQFDGYTSVIISTANVIPCETYHIKLVVSDIGDGIYDTAVFLGAGSFNAGGTASADAFSNITGTNIVYEDCPDGGFLFERIGNNLNSLITINISVDPSSTATPGVDYGPLPPFVIIPPGAASFFLPVSVFSDGIIEGQESIVLTLDNPCSCTNDEIVLYIEEPPPIDANLFDQELCGGGAVVLEPSVSGGVQNPAIYTYQWDDGTNAPILVAAPTETETYTVTVTDFCGSTDEAQATITVYPLPIVTLVSGVELVCDANAQSVFLEINIESGIESMPMEIVISQDGVPLSPPLVINPGDIPPYTYEVFGEGQYEIFSVNNGTNNLCEGIGAGFFQVSEVPMEAEIVSTNIGCSGDDDGTIQVTPTSGVPPFVYLWSNGLPDTTSYATNLGPGFYSVTVLDDVGCEAEVSGTIEDGEELEANAVSLSTPNCFNPSGGSAEADVIGGNPSYAYQWSNGANGQTITGLIPGFYEVTVTDFNGCTALSEVVIDDNTIPPVAIATTDGLIDCLNSTTTVNGDGSTEGTNITYQWSGPGIVSGGNTLNPIVNTPGSYTLVVTNADNGCTEEDVTVVIQNEDLPTAAIQSPPIIDCDNLQITIDGSGSSSNGNFTYEWTTPDGNIVNGGTTLFPEVDLEGTYILVVTNDDNGCTEDEMVTIASDLNPPTANAGPGQLLSCTANTVTLDGTGSTQGGTYTYNWVTNNGTIVSGGNTMTPQVSEAGTYDIIVTNTTNGCTDIASVDVDLNSDVPVADAGDDQTLDCDISNIVLDASNSSSGGTVTFNWTTNGGNFVSGQNSLTPEINSPGEYVLTVSDAANGCTAVSTVVVDENIISPQIEILPPAEINCDFPTVFIDGSNSTNTGNLVFTWTTSDGSFVGGQNTLTPEVDSDGTYELHILNEDNGCDEVSTVNVTMNIDTPDAQIAPPGALTCVATEITIDASSSLGSGPLQYSWTTSDGTIVSGDDSLTPIVNTAGTYDLLITNTASNCTSTASINVVEDNEIPTADAGQTMMIDCVTPEVTLQGVVSGNGPLNIQWTTVDGSIVSGSDTETPIVNSGGTYVLDIINPNNGCTATASVTIGEDANIPNADIMMPEVLTCDLTSITLDGSNSTAGANVQAVWSTSDGNFTGGQNTLTPSINQPGTYTLSIVDNANNCENTTSVTVIQDITSPTVTAIAGSLDCDDLTATLDGTGSSSNGNYDYQWLSLDGNTITNPTDLMASTNEPGDYLLTITNIDNGCIESLEIEVIQDINAPDALAQTPPEITCATDVVIINGTQSSLGSDFEYQWTTSGGNFVSGDNTLLPNVNASGTYDLLVTDITNGCTATDQVVVTENIDYPDAEAGPTDVINCYNSTLILDGTGSSLGGIFDIMWFTTDGVIEDGSTTINPEISASGTYEVMVTDLTNGCSTVDNVVITENFDTPSADAGSTEQLSCAIDELELDGSLSSTGTNISYSWTTANGVFSSNQDIINPTVSAPGVYDLIVTNTVSGCTEVASVEITQDDNAPQASIAPSDTLTCGALQVILDGTSSETGANISYEWSTIDGNIISGIDATTAWANAPGTYIITVFNAANNCSSSASVIVNENVAPPAAEAGNDQQLDCSSTFLSLSGLGSSAGTNYVYNWSVVSGGNIVGGANTTSPVVDAPGIYQIEVTNTWTGCTSTDEVTVTQSSDLPTAQAVAVDPITCAVSQVQIDGTGSSQGGAFSYQWTTADGIIISGGSSLTPTVGAAGTYQLVVLDGSNGCDNSFSVVVNEDKTEPIAEAGTTAVLTCSFPTVSLNGMGSDTGPTYIYQWDGPGSIFSDDSLEPTVTQSGTFTLVVINVANGCSSSDNVSVLDDMDAPIISILDPDELDCQVLQVTIDGTPSSNGNDFIYQWSTVNGNIVTGGNTLTPEVDEPGTYQLVITNTDNGCTEIGDIIISQELEAPTADAGQNFTRNCWDDVQPLDGTGSSSNGNYSYEWTSANGEIASGNNTLTPAITEGGIYQLVVTDNDNGCSSIDEVEVFEDAPEAELFLNQPYCAGDNGAISFNQVSGGIPPYMYSIDGGQSFSNNSFFTGVASGSYDVIVQDANGCEEDQDITIVTPAEVNVDLLTPEIEISWGDQTQIQTITNVPLNEIQSVSWTPSFGLSCVDCLDPMANPTETTIYTVTITDENGCQDKGNILIRVTKDQNVYIPNAFSPNGDGANDVFMIFSDGKSVAKIESFLVFNRWGETVYEQYDFQPDDPAHGWDGVHRGQKTNAAVYVWFALIEFVDGTVELYEGDVTLTK
ncbi:MAG: choice-of-anchor L domain-containing protein [Bacteroidetes bacterium]|nr:choice-of-anchor L domain-containing protein [Bacteroidota bacterium]